MLAPPTPSFSPGKLALCPQSGLTERFFRPLQKNNDIDEGNPQSNYTICRSIAAHVKVFPMENGQSCGKLPSRPEPASLLRPSISEPSPHVSLALFLCTCRCGNRRGPSCTDFCGEDAVLVAERS